MPVRRAEPFGWVWLLICVAPGEPTLGGNVYGWLRTTRLLGDGGGGCEYAAVAAQASREAVPSLLAAAGVLSAQVVPGDRVIGRGLNSRVEI